jgi:hypothetical protein
LAFFIRHFATASNRLSLQKLAYVTLLRDALLPPPETTDTPEQVFCRNGHLKLVLEDRRPNDKLAPWTHDGIDYSIVGGASIQPWGPGILKCLAIPREADDGI